MRRKKIKQRYSSGSTSDSTDRRGGKVFKQRGPSDDSVNWSVSKLLNAVNAVLYENVDNSACNRHNSVDISVLEAGKEVAETRGEWRTVHGNLQTKIF